MYGDAEFPSESGRPIITDTCIVETGTTNAVIYDVPQSLKPIQPHARRLRCFFTDKPVSKVSTAHLQWSGLQTARSCYAAVRFCAFRVMAGWASTPMSSLAGDGTFCGDQTMPVAPISHTTCYPLLQIFMSDSFELRIQHLSSRGATAMGALVYILPKDLFLICCFSHRDWKDMGTVQGTGRSPFSLVMPGCKVEISALVVYQSGAFTPSTYNSVCYVG